jgi:hypothetical protein
MVIPFSATPAGTAFAALFSLNRRAGVSLPGSRGSLFRFEPRVISGSESTE